ncbi:ran-specific GTPase-activating protein [Ixodes scapularis]|uniref:ran-specific GTPase-activating protein n=1 Tax=Ixodes scapularis TaxID=6945 RepID=UPI001161A70F|nr:ran-specific GTPase-activating protein [Ixodes scapularis]
MADDNGDSNKERSRNDSVGDQDEERAHSPDIHFEPVVKLPLCEVKTLEEDEEVLLKLRGKLYRYDTSGEPAEWKERGTGEVKILRNEEGCCRILMRRDKTFKICANHKVTESMELKPSHGSDRAWIWSTPADFADEEPKAELLALRFANTENAQKFKEKFEEAKQVVPRQKKDPEADAAADKLESLSIEPRDEGSKE